MTAIIFGETNDLHVQAVSSYLSDYIILDNQSIQNNISITTDLTSKPVVFLDNKPIKATSVYWRNLDISSFEYGEHLPNAVAYMQLFLESFSDAIWVNPLSSFLDHYTKLKQLRLLDICKPQTLITNNLFDARKFISMFESVAIKPVAGGEYIQRIYKPKKLKSKHLKQPITLQEFIPGVNIRTFVIGDKVYSAEVKSDFDDFRLDDFNYNPIELSEAETELALNIKQKLGYQWTAIDWIRYNDNLYFLEANFSPMFLFFESETSFPITKKLANLLIQ